MVNVKVRFGTSLEMRIWNAGREEEWDLYTTLVLRYGLLSIQTKGLVIGK